MNAISRQPLIREVDTTSREEISKLGALSSSRFCFALGGDLAVCAGAIALSEHLFFNPLIYIFSVILIGSRLHGLGILMHDCIHYRAFKTRKLNMLVGEALAWSVLTTAEGYRNNHLTHHRHLNTNEDPDWARKSDQRSFNFPKRKRELLGTILYQVSGLGIVELFLGVSRNAQMKQISTITRISRLGFYIVLLTICAFAGLLGKIALYWLVPMISTFPLVAWIRSAAEHHGGLEYDHAYRSSRTTIPSRWEAFLIMPHNVGYHLEHHLYPHVPFYRLEALHRLLMQRASYAENAHVTHGVCAGLLKEFTGAGTHETSRYHAV